jgi:hypothetical protein
MTAVRDYGGDDESTECCAAFVEIHTDGGGFFCKKCFGAITEALDAEGKHKYYLTTN